MIESKKDLKYYLKQDKIALGIPSSRVKPRLFYDEAWRYQIALRKAEYCNNCLKGRVFTPIRLWYKLRYHILGVKYGFTIGLNSFGPGLSIAHYGTIVVNGSAVIGKNCRIQEGVNIGSTSGSTQAAIIGDNVFIGSGAKIIGEITIANDIAIGAGAVVVKSFTEPGITIAGNPARKISNKGSISFINTGLD